MTARTDPQKEKAMNEKKLVLDKYRGIYWGTVEEVLEGGNAVRMTAARHCYRYCCVASKDPAAPEARGAYSLATHGPAAGSLVGPAVSMTVRDVAKIVDVSPQANARWEGATWGS